MNEPQPADDRAERIAELQKRCSSDIKWLLDELEKADERLDAAFKLDDGRYKANMKLMWEGKIAHKKIAALEAKIAQIRAKAEKLRSAAPELPADNPLWHAEFDWVRTLIADEIDSIIDGGKENG